MKIYFQNEDPVEVNISPSWLSIVCRLVKRGQAEVRLRVQDKTRAYEVPGFCSNKCQRAYLEWLHFRHHSYVSFASFFQYREYLRRMGQV